MNRQEQIKFIEDNYPYTQIIYQIVELDIRFSVK